MQQDAPPPASAGFPEAPGQNPVRALMRGWSLEATMPKEPELAAMREHLPPGSQVFLSALPTVAVDKLVHNARQVSLLGLEPVPHVAVRNFASREALAAFLGELRRQAGVKRLLVIAGDRDQPEGPFESSLDLIRSGLLQEAGIERVYIGGYPDGHPKISRENLAASLRAKIIAARAVNLEVGVVSQFCFDAKTILGWVLQVRYDFPDLPVRVGLAGPANAQTLFKYAVRCGVRASARGLGRGLVLIRNLKGEATPTRIVEALAAGSVGRNEPPIALHLYAFGGVAKTAGWGKALAEGVAPPAPTEP